MIWIDPVSLWKSLETALFLGPSRMLNESMSIVMVEIMFVVWPCFHGIFLLFYLVGYYLFSIFNSMYVSQGQNYELSSYLN